MTGRPIAGVLLLVLMIMSLAQALPGAAETPVMKQDFLIIVPSEFVDGFSIMVAGVTPFNITLDYNLNGFPDPGEQTIQMPGEGRIAVVLLRLPDNITGDVFARLVVTGGPATILSYYHSTDGSVAYTAPKLGTILLPPPGGVVLVANPGPEIAHVVVGGEEYVLPPLRVLRVCPGGESIVIQSDIPVAAVAYGYQDGDYWATEVLPDTETVRVIGFSSLQAGATVDAVVRYTTGGWEAYSAESLVEPWLMPGEGAVYYVVRGNGIGVAPAYDNSLTGAPLLFLTSRGMVLGSNYTVAHASIPGASYALYDRNGDGLYEVTLFLDRVTRSWINAGSGRTLALYVDGPPPLVYEKVDASTVLYSYAYPFTGSLDYDTLWSLLGEEITRVTLSLQGGNATIQVSVTPRLGLGGVVSAAAALFDTGLNPIPGTATPLDPAGDGSLRGVITAPPETIEDGAYLIGALAYQEGAGLVTSMVSSSPATVESTENPLQDYCSDPAVSIGEAVRPSSLEPTPLHSIAPPSLADLDIEGLGSLILEATPQGSTTETYSPPDTATTATSPPRPNLPVTEPEGGEPSPTAYYTTITITLLIIILIILWRSNLISKIT